MKSLRVFEPAKLDCGASDAELIQHLYDPSSPSCPAVAAVGCESAEDCPAGLACNGGVCGRCSDLCSYPEGRPEEAVCEGDRACAAGELCTVGLCVPAANLSCRFFTDCPTDNSCVLSGVSRSGRGNAETRSLCQPYRSF